MPQGSAAPILHDDGMSYSTEDDQIVVGEGVAIAVQPAGFLLRLASGAIDAAVYLIAFGLSAVLVLQLITGYVETTGAAFDGGLVAPIIIVTTVVMLVIVPSTVEALSNGKSLGKLALGIRIVRDDGGAIAYRHAFIRALTGYLAIYASSGAIAAVVGLLNSRAKRLGDMLAGTTAQLERVPRPRPTGLTLPPVLAGWAQVADVARLPDRVARRLHDFALQASKLTGVSRRNVAAELARECAPYVSPSPDFDAETFIAGVAVLRRDREYRALALAAERLAIARPILESAPAGFPTGRG